MVAVNRLEIFKRITIYTISIVLLVNIILPVTLAEERSKVLIGRSEIYLLGAYEDSSGNKHGIYSKLLVEVYQVNEGTGGKVYISVMPVPDKMFYMSAIIASKIAALMTGKSFYDLEFHYTIISSSVSIEGPSAGAAMAVAAIAAILNCTVPNDKLITGMLLPGGIIGPVGSLKEKVEAASELHCKYLFVPYGQSETPLKTSGGYIRLRDYAKSFGIEVVDVLSIDSAVKDMLGASLSSTRPVVHPEYNKSELVEYLESSVMQDIKHIKDLESMFLNTSENGTLPESAYSYLKDFMDKFNITFSEGLNLTHAGNYYSALSKFFQASIYIRAAYYIKKYYFSNYPPSTLGEIYSNVTRKIFHVEGLLNTTTAEKVSIGEFYTLGATEFRCLESEYYLRLFNTTAMYPERIPEALYYLAFAYERARTAEWWYNVPLSLEDNATVDLYTVAMESLAYAQSMIEFLDSIGGSSQELTTLKEYLWIAYRSLEKGYYPGTFFASTAIIATVTLVTYKMYISAEYLGNVADKLQMMLGSIIDRLGNNPHFVLLSRLEYGDVLKQTNVDSAMYMFLEGIILSTLYHTKQTIIIEEENNESSVEINIERGIRSEIFFIVGLIAGLVLGVTLLSKD